MRSCNIQTMWETATTSPSRVQKHKSRTSTRKGDTSRRLRRLRRRGGMFGCCFMMRGLSCSSRSCRVMRCRRRRRRGSSGVSILRGSSSRRTAASCRGSSRSIRAIRFRRRIRTRSSGCAADTVRVGKGALALALLAGIWRRRAKIRGWNVGHRAARNLLLQLRGDAFKEALE